MENKDKELTDSLIYSKEILEFITVANEYCRILENLNDFPLNDFFDKVYKTSSLLHLKILSFQKPEIPEKMPSETFLTEADWHYIDSAISKKLGQFEIYTDLTEPENPDTPVNISMSECLTDTYQDLKDFINIYQIASEDVILSAVYDLKTNFELFWGPRILIILKEFHTLLFGNEELKEEESEIQTQISKGKNWVNELFNDED